MKTLKPSPDQRRRHPWRLGPAPLPHDPALRGLLLTEMLDLLASAAAQVCVLWWLAQQGGAFDLTLYAGMTALGALLALPLMSPLGDRLPKPQLIRWGMAALFLASLLMLLLATSGHYHLLLIGLCSLVSVLARALVSPGLISILPELVATEALPQAIRLRRGAQALGGLLGPALGGTVLALAGLSGTLALAALGFAFALLAARRLQAPRFAPAAAHSTGWRQDLLAGLRAKWAVPLDRWRTLIGALMMVFYLPAIGLLLPLRLQALQLSAVYLGACSASLSLGLLIGVAGLADALIRQLGRLRAMYTAIAVCGMALASVAFCERAPGLMLAYGLMGLCMSVTQLVGQTHRLLAMPAHLRSRMSAVQLTIAQLAATLAPTLAGALLQSHAVDTVYLMLAGGFLGCGLLLLAVPELGLFLRLDHAQVKNWYALRYPQAFQPPA